MCHGSTQKAEIFRQGQKFFGRGSSSRVTIIYVSVPRSNYPKINDSQTAENGTLLTLKVVPKQYFDILMTKDFKDLGDQNLLC